MCVCVCVWGGVPLNNMEIAFFATFLLVHSVLKWLHFLVVLKNVMLLHHASSWHDFWHAARSEALPDDSLR